VLLKIDDAQPGRKRRFWRTMLLLLVLVILAEAAATVYALTILPQP
jgi:hypothetical protein